MNSNIVKRAPAAYGDVIGINRGLYQHYGIYISDDRIIEYGTKSGDFSGEISVHEVTLKKFLGEDTDYFICRFPEETDDPFLKNLLTVNLVGLAQDLLHLMNGETYHLYSPEETVARAESRLGEKSYNIALNNCEHFAIWCKTGLSKSTQVNRILSFLERSVEGYLLYRKLQSVRDQQKKDAQEESDSENPSEKTNN